MRQLGVCIGNRNSPTLKSVCENSGADRSLLVAALFSALGIHRDKQSRDQQERG